MEEDTNSLAGKCKKVMQILETAVAPTGVPLSRPFLKLPSRRDFPEYYKMIKQPLSMNQIKQRISSYTSPSNLQADFQQIFTNAQTFNKPGSEIFLLAKSLQQLFEHEFAKYFPSGSISTPPSSTTNAPYFMDISSPKNPFKFA